MLNPLPIPEFKPSQPIPFTDAIEYFRRQAPWISGSSWNTMARLAALKGDQISGTTLLAVLDDVWGQMDRAVAEGKPYGSFVRDVADVLNSRWYEADSKRLRLIYHNNVGGALMAGREAHMADPDIREARPYVMFDGIGDWRQTVDICKPRDGTILPADDVWWMENSPMLHHGCRSGKITLDEEDALEYGGVTDQRKLTTFAPPQQGWGRPSSWSAWAPTPENYHVPLMEEYTRWINGEDYIHDKQTWDQKWQKFVVDEAASQAAVETAKPKKPRAARKPKAVQENPPVQAPEPGKIPPLQSGVNLSTATPALESFGAITLLGDGSKLRGQAWRVQRADVVAGSMSESNYTLTGELDKSVWAGLGRVMRAKGAQDKHWESHARVGLFDPDADTASSPIKLFDMTKPTRFLGGALVYDDPDLNYRVTFAGANSHTAMQGKIKIEVFSSDPLRAQELLEKALKDLELDKHKLDAKPTPKDVTLAKASRALWNIEGGSYQRPTTVAAAEQRLSAHGVDLNAITTQQNSLGYEELRLPGRWKTYRQRGAKFLYHQFRTSENAVRGISGADGGKGGLLSTVARTENGVIIDGISSSTDLGTGGASSTFTRLVGDSSTDAARSWYSSYTHTAILSPKILDRLDWYGYGYDNYGRTNDSAFANRDGADEHVRNVTENGRTGNEMMFRNAVAREDILFFAVTDSSQRNSFLATLRAANVQSIRGQPIEEMVVIMRTPTDYSRLNSNNPVHAFLMGTQDTCPEWSETYGDTR